MNTVKSYLILFFFVLLVFTSCTNIEKHEFYSQAENSHSFNDSLSFRHIGDISFPLDSNSAMTSYSVQYLDLNEGKYFSVLSATETFINIYDYSEREIINKVNLHIEGPNGIGYGDGLMAHYMINLDSFLIYNYHQMTLYLINNQAEVIKKYKVQNKYKRDQDFAVPEPSTLRPIKFVNNKVYLMGSLTKPDIGNPEDSGLVIIIDLMSGKIERRFQRSSVYEKGNWKGHYMKTALFGDLNPNSGKFVYSFGADPFVYETNHKGFNKKYYASSSQFRTVAPLSMDRKKNYDSKKVKYYDFTSASFNKIVYDQYRDLYYRFVFLPLNEHEYIESPGPYNGKEAILILDKNFNKIGEYNLPRYTYEFYNFFVTHDGLMLKLKPNKEKNDEEMTYHVFSVNVKNG